MQAAQHGRCELLGAGVDRRHRRHCTGEGRHDGFTGEGTEAEVVARLGLGQHLDADLLPVVGDQREGVVVLGLFARMLDDDSRGAAVGQQAETLAVLLGEADLVQQLVGQLGIVVGPLGRVLGLEQLGARHDRVVRGLRETDIDDLVQFLAVDCQRQRPAEAHVTHQLAPLLVVGGQVGIERDL